MRVSEQEAIAMNHPGLVHELLKDGFNPIQEEMHLIVMDTKNKIIEKILLYKGGGNTIMAEPADIF